MMSQRNQSIPRKRTRSLKKLEGMSEKKTVFSQHQAFSKCFLTSGPLDEAAQAGKKNCLIGCSGSVAALKVPELAVELMKRDFNVLIVCSEKAKFFLDKAEDYNPLVWAEFIRLGGYSMLLQDADEWGMWEKIGNVVLHIELRKWADVLVVAPASASMLAKAAAGICDHLLLSVMRAWDFSKPCYLCPAMNTIMWEHPVTNPTLSTLQGWGWQVIDPVGKLLACKDVGMGAMASASTIVDAIASAVSDEVIAAEAITPAEQPPSGSAEAEGIPQRPEGSKVDQATATTESTDDDLPAVPPDTSKSFSSKPAVLRLAAEHLTFSDGISIGTGVGLGLATFCGAVLVVCVVIDAVISSTSSRATLV